MICRVIKWFRFVPRCHRQMQCLPQFPTSSHLSSSTRQWTGCHQLGQSGSTIFFAWTMHCMCTMHGIEDPFPVSERTLCHFAAFLADNGKAHQTIVTYLSALRNAQISMGLPDPRDQSSHPVLKRIHAGIQRTLAAGSAHPRRVRLPVTVPMLRAIRSTLDTASDPERELIWAVASLAFFGFFRLG